MVCEHTSVQYNDFRVPVSAHQLVQMVCYFFGCLCLERDNFWPFGEVVNYHENISMAIGFWLEADHQINGYLVPGFVRHNHTVELCRCTSFATWHL